MSGGKSPPSGEDIATLLRGDRYQGDSKWPKKWWDTTSAQAREVKPITNNDGKEEE
jgi:hypothetical protein